ncbi:hypothetical protein Efla_000952 [Eimeria flavescens]
MKKHTFSLRRGTCLNLAILALCLLSAPFFFVSSVSLRTHKESSSSDEDSASSASAAAFSRDVAVKPHSSPPAAFSESHSESSEREGASSGEETTGSESEPLGASGVEGHSAGEGRARTEKTRVKAHKGTHHSHKKGHKQKKARPHAGAAESAASAAESAAESAAAAASEKGKGSRELHLKETDRLLEGKQMEGAYEEPPAPKQEERPISREAINAKLSQLGAPFSLGFNHFTLDFRQ